eukprot:CAMPEP_0174374332 /NCGR_PEP_ID=MMETSP0811_2-20130205/110532_1 /TAXON_ID=73025 ORGANISM="Eutreptiella gymnastica-like, Strain CCMP1594" /NCGR_SAMPLE_ID=MMETSP0811_2 /ASSEMBLY_ACC=CAM_ASM_000667 /LENGTH=61 /DNA_ID=CAMNT_0015523565 /DNA_START=1313 /DNA_END=1498 /DNA_ORIENTATION=-
MGLVTALAQQVLWCCLRLASHQQPCWQLDAGAASHVQVNQNCRQLVGCQQHGVLEGRCPEV